MHAYIHFTLNIFIGVAVLGLFTGCANLNSIHRNLNISDGNGVLIDIKQRAIIAVKTEKGQTMVCAEPSPEAMSAYMAELAAKGEVATKSAAQLTTAAREASSFTGLRTHSIQLLRDVMFNNCLRFINGTLTSGEYNMEARILQKQMVALLAIEQLTGIVRVPTVAIDTSSSAEASRSLANYREALAANDAKLLELKKSLAATDQEPEKAELNAKIHDAEADHKAYAKGIENATGTIVSGKTTTRVGDTSTVSRDASVSVVSDAVQDLATKILQVDNKTELCFIAMQYKSADVDSRNLQKYCNEFLMADLEYGRIQRKALEAAIEKTETLTKQVAVNQPKDTVTTKKSKEPSKPKPSETVSPSAEIPLSDQAPIKVIVPTQNVEKSVQSLQEISTTIGQSRQQASSNEVVPSTPRK
jgi:hypothetical protein